MGTACRPGMGEVEEMILERRVYCKKRRQRAQRRRRRRG